MRLNLCLILGIQGYKMKVEDIADVLGVSHQRVTQLEQSALKKIRKALQKHNITYEELLLCLKHS